MPFVFSSVIDVMVSTRRLQDYFMSLELDLSSVERYEIDEVGVNAASVQIVRGTYAWSHEFTLHPTLEGINLEVQRGELVFVVGQVGAGKSSLISALLGEMDRRAGDACIVGSVAYVNQQRTFFY